MRHDIDFSLEKALEIAKIESNMGVKSTFFLLITSNFYNVFSLEAEKIIREIISLNHKIGLHFDETRYDNNDFNLLIHKEIKLLEDFYRIKVDCVSFHRPSNSSLINNYDFGNIINSYSNTYFKEMLYVSDSRRNWKMDVINIIKTKSILRLHLLTHPIWYSDISKDLALILNEFANERKISTINSIKKNIRNSDDIFRSEGIN